MTDENLIKMAEDMPNFAQEELDRGFSVCYMSDEYPEKILKENPDGKLVSIDVNVITGEMKVLEILRSANEK